jgi:hypothetical protein
MPRGYRKKKRNIGRIFALAIIPASALLLALSWVWKSNQVKDYYKELKELETERTNLISENMRLRANLMDLKSLSNINAVVTERFGLTQSVSQRIFLADPVEPRKSENKSGFAGDIEIPDWLENAVIGSGRIRAEQPADSGEGTE